MRNIKFIRDNVYHVRKHVLGKTQEEFAEMLGVDPETISNIERGKYIPSTQTLAKLADVTGKSMDYFLTDKETKQNDAYIYS